MWDKALELASRITHPWTVAVFVSVIAAAVLVFAPRVKSSRLPRPVWIILSLGIVVLGISPLLASAFLQSRGLYRVRIVVMGLDHSPIDDAHVLSSVGGEPKKVESGWEFDIPPQSRPADGKVKLFASERNSFLAGSATLVLDKDYYPTADIQLEHDTSATVPGAVVDERGRSVAGAHVSISGYSEVATTNEMGNFSLPAHAADGQMVRLRAQKGRLSADVSVPAGDTAAELVLK